MTCCSGSPSAVARHFDARYAEGELSRYRKQGPLPTTRLLADALRAMGVSGASLLDIGSGVGALTLELLQAGARKATLIDASAPLLAVARAEAERRGFTNGLEFISGDFTDLADTIPEADIALLDRVVCCYPAYQPLLEAAARRSTVAVALSYPRARWFVKAGVAIENLMRRVRNRDFRTFVHSPELMAGVLQQAGFRLAHRETTPGWSIEVHRRISAEPRDHSPD